MFDLFSELFSPGRKHTTEERKRLELSREDLGDSDPSRGPIDLSSGKVTLRLTGPAGTAAPDPTAEAERPDEPDPPDEAHGPGRPDEPGRAAVARPDTPA
ncbi:MULTISPECIES: DUF6191 domain-containing protein [unclassified Streptomyces]|uniref:DUF6191 domain-containing protein n=1 Tax=unclassified Streptomyces TaxID=2593676 RepID=UPI00080551DA|nr:DUF6191 domain-containing protein [Streptomyces sp. OspMP-M45]MYR76138.1 hypothetical protein [Streptomyces sp. SID4925]SBU96440.1 hypothetical protein YUMDRAFT_05417 [Streptomyces sp. OspMP-M45]